MRQVLTTALVLMIATAALAITPNQINYQGRLATSGGTPVADGSYSVVFTIYSADVGGTVEWTETQTVTTISGSFTARLGSINAISDTVFSGWSRYLGIKVGADPEMTPRVALLTVPYAFRVSTLDGATGGHIYSDLDLGNSADTSGNIRKNGSLFLHNFANNTFLGADAGNLTMTGSGNTGVGFHSLFRNTTGWANVALGGSALGNNTSGYWNTACGSAALGANSTGIKNTAIGEQTLWTNTSGEENTATGFIAMYLNTTGARNTANGSNALYANTTGYCNTAVGSSTLVFNSEGNSNTGCGTAALHENTIGNHNTATGFAALFQNTSGVGNTAAGYESLRDDTTGSYNTGVGYHSNVSFGNLTNATAIGANAIVNASNKIRLGDANITVIEGQVAYTFTSDKNQKENFQPVDGTEVLSKIRKMSLASWNYKGNDPAKFRHYGPVAQEFFAAFGHDGVGAVRRFG